MAVSVVAILTAIGVFCAVATSIPPGGRAVISVVGGLRLLLLAWTVTRRLNGPGHIA
jgi:hypothetical protein